jgi:DNA-binding beta-propeller fold protein YncE
MKHPVIIIPVFLSLFFCFQLANGQTIKLIPAWESDTIFDTPESAVYDSINNCIYIGNFNDEGGFRRREDTLKNEFISKIDLQGNILELKWIDGLFGPTGIAIFEDKLFAVERGFLTSMDIPTGTIEYRYPIPDFGFPNDIVIDDQGIIYISDSEKNCIYHFSGKKVEIWLQDSLISGPNGLCIDGQNLIIGNSNENNLLSVSLADKKVTVIAKNTSKIVDGIMLYNDHFIISGRTKIVITDLSGMTNELIDSNNQEEWYADFDLVPDRQMLVIPTLFSNRVVAFRIK